MLSSFQSAFIPGDTTINQLTGLYHTSCEALDAGKEVRAVFFDIKAFDRVRYTGLIYELELYVLVSQGMFSNGSEII